MLRTLFAASIVTVALGAGMAHAQTCDATTFVQVCDAAAADQLDVCANGTVTPVDCNTIAPGSTCAGAGSDCDGTGCAQIAEQESCSSPIGGTCLGLNQLFDPNGSPGAILCDGNATCKTQVDASGQALEDVCVAHNGPACVAGAADSGSCEGSILSICLADTAGTFALASNLQIDCAFITFDGNDPNAAPAGCGKQTCTCDAQCGTDGHCIDGFCDADTFCVDPTPDPALCGAEGEGAGGGEGEAAAECNSDSQCGRDKECVNGACKAKDDASEAGPGCSSNGAGAPLAGLAAVIAILPLFRRRRRA